MIEHELLPWAEHYETILDELRCQDHPQHRMEAARLLADEEDYPERITYLLNAVLYDPDAEVREEIFGILNILMGNQLPLALQMESMGGEPYENPWLIECSMPEKYGGKQRANPFQDEIKALLADQDLGGLVSALRDPYQYKRRVLAARALGETGNRTIIEALARATIEDPDERVQQAALESLYLVAGEQEAMDLLNQVNLASYEEEWLLIPDELEFINGDAETSEDSLFAIGPGGYQQGLTMMARSDRNPENRLRAIEELARRNDIFINHTVTEIALFDDDARVKKFAHDVLEGKLGDQLAEFLADFQKNWDGTETDPNDDESPDQSAQPKVSEFMQSKPMMNTESVISEGKPPYLLILVLGILAILLFLYFTGMFN